MFTVRYTYIYLGLHIHIFMFTYSMIAGKSTTTAMLAYVLNAMDDDLTAIVGAEVPQVL